MTPESAEDLLGCATPPAWLDAAVRQLPVLLSDHATCERKAAATALGLIHRYVDRADLRLRLSRLAREELRHFEQVLAQMQRARVGYLRLPPGRYASRLRAFVRTVEPGRLVDLLLVGGVIEARSCERFSSLCRVLDGELGRFYEGLCAAEARHFGVYLDLAKGVAPSETTRRLEELLTLERQLVESPDASFRFHSGVPV